MFIGLTKTITAQPIWIAVAHIQLLTGDATGGGSRIRMLDHVLTVTEHPTQVLDLIGEPTR